jgi:hypothetical protein
MARDLRVPGPTPSSSLEGRVPDLHPIAARSNTRRLGTPPRGMSTLSLLDECRSDYIRAVPTINLTDDELAAVTAAVRRTIKTTAFPTPHAWIPCGRRWRGSTRRQSRPRTRRPRRRPKATSGRGVRASVDQVDCLVRADIDIGHIRRLTVGVFPAQIHVTILALRYFGPRPLAGFQRA